MIELSYWRYTRNEAEGRNSAETNVYGYSLDVIELVVALRLNIALEKTIQKHLQGKIEPSQIQLIKVKPGKSDLSGYEVHVSAPSQIWEAAYAAIVALEDDEAQC